MIFSPFCSVLRVLDVVGEALFLVDLALLTVFCFVLAAVSVSTSVIELFNRLQVDIGGTHLRLFCSSQE